MSLAMSVLMALLAAAAEQPLDRPCPVQCRGERLADALSGLAGRVQAAYLLDASVDAQALDRRVRFSAWHLSGEEAMRWLARSVGLEAVLVRGVFLVAEPERLPLAWRLTGRAQTDRAQGAARARWEAAQSRRADVHWLDVPLSRVSADMATAFGVDVVFHGDILADQPLIGLEQREASLTAVLEALGEQLGARADYVDGALWMRQGGSAGGPDSRPAGETVADQAGMALPGPLDRWVILDRKASTWPAVASLLSGGVANAARIEVSSKEGGPAIDSAGTAGEILEAAALLGRFSWRLEPPAPGRPAGLQIKVGSPE